MDDPVIDIFNEEAREHLAALEAGFLDLESAAAPGERRPRIDSLFRHAHSLKGDARAIGLPELQQAAQGLEDVLDGLRSDPDAVNREAINDGLSRLDLVRNAFEEWQKRRHPEEPAPPAAAAPAPPPVERSPAEPPAPPSAADESFSVRVPSERLDRMLNLAGELRTAQLSVEGVSIQLADLNRTLSAALDACKRLEKSARAEADAAPAVRTGATSVRQQLDYCRDQIARIENALRNKRNRQDLLLEALETDVREARLLPLSLLADSLRRAVRELSQSLGKPIRYEVEAGGILLDKAVIESLKDPLLHLFRNAAHHGIEEPAAREQAGKPAEGTIRLSASRHGNGVRIRVSDDGRGVDFERIRERVRATEGLNDSHAAALTREELATYLFRPGFTTARATDAISGRGVGLDVVHSTARRLQGAVTLESSSVQGTTFAITVPVTLSTMRILTVVCEGQLFGIPGSMVERTGRVRPDELRMPEGRPVLSADGAPVRWVPLATLLGMPPPATVEGQARPYVLIRQEGRSVAVGVDDLEEEGEVLLKPLGFPLGRLPGIVGATIRPDGSVQLVLDVPALVFRPSAAPLPRTAEARPPGRLLIVDDSPTTRAILRNTFSAAGYAIRTAGDGVEALEALRAGGVDLVITDVEMPRMDGFELTRQIKTRHRLPVILVTGMEKEEHRRKGLAAGADAYVVKSTFQGEGLLDIVRQFV